MIELKRLNGTSFFLNPELVEQMERTPDTVITLVTGNNLVVLETPEEVTEKILAYRKKVNGEGRPRADAGLVRHRG